MATFLDEAQVTELLDMKSCIYLIVDGRGQMQSLLARRLFGA